MVVFKSLCLGLPPGVKIAALPACLGATRVDPERLGKWAAQLTGSGWGGRIRWFDPQLCTWDVRSLCPSVCLLLSHAGPPVPQYAPIARHDISCCGGASSVTARYVESLGGRGSFVGASGSPNAPTVWGEARTRFCTWELSVPVVLSSWLAGWPAAHRSYPKPGASFLSFLPSALSIASLSAVTCRRLRHPLCKVHCTRSCGVLIVCLSLFSIFSLPSILPYVHSRCKLGKGRATVSPYRVSSAIRQFGYRRVRIRS